MAKTKVMRPSLVTHTRNQKTVVDAPAFEKATTEEERVQSVEMQRYITQLRRTVRRKLQRIFKTILPEIQLTKKTYSSKGLDTLVENIAKLVDRLSNVNAGLGLLIAHVPEAIRAELKAIRVKIAAEIKRWRTIRTKLDDIEDQLHWADDLKRAANLKKLYSSTVEDVLALEASMPALIAEARAGLRLLKR